MSQMVLPQNLSNSAPSDAARSQGASRPGNEKSGQDSFDAVSRTEQKRLEARQASEAQAAKDARQARENERAEESRQAESRAAKEDQGSARAEQPGSEKAGTEKPVAEKATDNSAADGKPEDKESSGEKSGQEIAAEVSPQGKAGENLELLSGADDGQGAQPADEAVTDVIDTVPVTFADLQSLVASGASAKGPPTPGKGVGGPANSQGLPFVQGSMLSMAGLNGKPGAMSLQPAGQGGSPSGMALAETLLAGVTGEGPKASDSPLLQNAIRFQGVLESVSAQTNAVNTPKMAPDAPILRGYTTSIDLPVGHAEWGDKVAGKLTWLTARNMSVAEIHLSPPDMGPMEVKVSVQQDQANIQVHSANPVVREQLELHSHRLRDMLNEQGLSLEQFDISDSGRDQAGDGESGSGEPTGNGIISEAELESGQAEPGSLDLTWKGEVDIFA